VRTTVAGRTACYGEAGEGPPVVFLHGWGLGQHAYKRPLRRLAARGRRVVAPALPGFGGTADLPAPERTIPGYAAWVEDFLATVGVDEPAIVVGHSFGGGVAIGLACAFPARVERLVLVNSVGGAVWGVGRGLSERPVWEWGLGLARELLPPAQGLQIARSAREDLLPNVLRNPRALWDVGVIARQADLRAELAELRRRGVPVLVVSGEADGVIPTSAFEALCAALGTDGSVVPGNHTWLLSNPDAFDTVMANVLEASGAPEAHVTAVRDLLRGTSLPKALADDLVATAPALWRSSDTAAALAGDLALCHPPLRPDEVRARVTSADDGRWRLTVLAHDRPGLLADAAGVLATESMSIAGASLATWEAVGTCLMAITVDPPAPDGATLERLGTRLEAMGSDGAAPPLFLPAGDASVRRTGEANGDALVTVTAPDRPGLLWALCRAVADQGGSILAAAVASDNGEARDTFVVRGDVDLALVERRITRQRPWPERVLSAAVGVLR
jgi:pimeloyl-ACP methyl ester carboxylesterase/glycine cleavage system regulatory protein